jgi:hypothetical protein
MEHMAHVGRNVKYIQGLVRKPEGKKLIGISRPKTVGY